MIKAPLRLAQIARKNFTYYYRRSLILLIIVAIFAFILAGSLSLLKSMARGVDSAVNRLGADVILVPPGYDSKIRGALLRGEPNNFYMPGDVLTDIQGFPGIEAVSPQLYIATLQATCCSYPLQIIGFEPESDFLIRPWLREQAIKRLHQGEIVIGFNVAGKTGEKLSFFNKDYRIVGRLDKTGMGFDNSVFMNMDTARAIALDSKRGGAHPALGEDHPISVLMLRLSSDVDTLEIRQELNQFFQGRAYALSSENLMREVRLAFSGLEVYLTTLTALLCLMTILLLGLVYTLQFRERIEEYRSCCLLGANCCDLRAMMVWETLYSSAAGALLGASLGTFLTHLFGLGISHALRLPYLSSSAGASLGYFLLSFVFVSMIAPLAAIFSAFKISCQLSQEGQTFWQEGELEAFLKKKSLSCRGLETSDKAPSTMANHTAPGTGTEPPLAATESGETAGFPTVLTEHTAVNISEAAMQPLLSAQQVSKFYRRGQRIFAALDQVDFSLFEHGFAILSGASGAGKSTLLKLLCGLAVPDQGEVLLRGRAFSNCPNEERNALRNSEMGVIPQRETYLAALNLRENVLLPLSFAHKKSAHEKEREVQKLDALLSQFGLSELADSAPATLSGGELKRLQIARALLSSPAIIVADEPTANLDSENARNILDIFQALNQQGQSIVMVTHELDALAYGKTLYRLRDGRIESIKDTAGFCASV